MRGFLIFAVFGLLLTSCSSSRTGGVTALYASSVETASKLVVTNAMTPFMKRCAAAGVFKCISFDDEADFVTSGGFPVQTVYPDTSGTFANVKRDCTVAVSGCAVRFTVTASPVNGANVAGKYEYDFVKQGKQFGQNSTFYVQLRARFDGPMLANNFGGEGWKFVLIYGGKTSCSNLGLLNQNTWYYGFPTMAHECSPGIFTSSSSGQYLQQGDYNCLYGSVNRHDCGFFKADEWMTFYWRIHIGNWEQPNSSLDAWLSYENEPLRKWISQPKFTFKFEDGPSDVLDKVALTPYITNRKEAAPSDGHMWFDELIVSGGPIPAPNGPTP